MSFQEKVWKLLEKVPKGRVTTYKIIAEKLGTRAYRAVGTACHNNPYTTKAACHRVITSNGRIGGFRTGVKEKIELLEKEGIEIENNKVKDFEKILFRF